MGISYHLCRYAWTCHNCKCVLPLDKEIVYDHIQKCMASCVLVKMTEFSHPELVAAEAESACAPTGAKLMYITDYQI